MWSNRQETVDLVIFTEEILNRKIHFLCSVNSLQCFLCTEFSLKLVSVIFCQIFIFRQMIAIQKIWKMFFISSKKLFSFSRYSNFVILSSPLFLPVSHCFRDWSKTNLKVYDIINSLNKTLITHFIWYLEKEKRYDIETW